MDTVFDKPLKEDNAIRYRGRTHSSTGRLSLGVGIAGWVVFAVLILESINPPAGSYRIGIIGCLDLILGILGMLFGGRGLRESNVYYRSALAGVVLCATLTASLFGLFLSGLQL